MIQRHPEFISGAPFIIIPSEVEESLLVSFPIRIAYLLFERSRELLDIAGAGIKEQHAINF